MSESLLVPLLISLKVAGWATLLVFPPGILIGYLLARRLIPATSILETLVTLPLVLPPTAVGYALLRGLSREGLDLGILLTWKAAVISSCVMALPLVARTARVAFGEIDPRLESIARTLGAGPVRTFFEVTLPLARRGLLAAAIIGFSRALGEFGATVIVAGNIPGKTQTLALAIFSDIQLGRDDRALRLLGITVVLAFAAIWSVEALQRRGDKRK